MPPEKGRFLSGSRSILSMAYRDGLRNDSGIGGSGPDAFGEIDLDFETDLLSLAYDVSERAHAGTKRRNGEPYFTHPVAVAKVLLEDFPNPTTFKAIVGLLHDVIEDSEHPEETKAALLETFRKEVMAKESEMVKKHGIVAGTLRIEGMLRFCNEIVEGVHLLSKKRKEAYLAAWEIPLYRFEENLASFSESIPGIFWWSPAVRPSRHWNDELKRRADADYLGRFETLLGDRLFFAVLQVKLADRFHNLCTSYHEETFRIGHIIEETEAHYLGLAEKTDETIFRLISDEIVGLKAELVRREVAARTEGAIARKR